MFPAGAKIDSLRYLMNLQPKFGFGSLHRVGGKEDGKHLGDWSGQRTACRESDFQL